MLLNGNHVLENIKLRQEKKNASKNIFTLRSQKGVLDESLTFYQRIEF